MSVELNDLRARIRSLSVVERAELLREFLAPESPFDPAVEAEWLAEIERRVAEVDAGTVKLIPADEVFARLDRRLHG
jgi:putative addiction module component (TIGR02574 family)